MSTKRVIYSDLEKQVFLEILKKYKHTIESKGTNSSTLKEKSEAWFIITQEYNESPLISNKRDVSQLKKYWSNLKQQNKNILTAERQARFLTGGGPQKNVGEVDSNVLDIIPSLLTTAPTMSSSNFTRNESTDRQKEIFKAVKQNKSASDLNNILIEVDEDDSDGENLYSILHEEENIQEEPNKQSDVMTNEKKYIYLDSKRTNHTDSLNSTSKKSKVDRSNVICEKELELANIKINHEIEICQLRKEREEFINELTVRKLLLEEKELKERVKLAKFQAQKEI
ncbi:uncharacterized protein [Temnothorax longispinosus]|uniref:uncharacterized protein isoform X2 n=1 Tax=Temnothorax longispinosus TaxID=300112 RepID=UPI003A99EC63